MVVIHCRMMHPAARRPVGTHTYIGRPGPFGNPFIIGQHGNRDDVIKMYEKWARQQPVLLDLIKALPEDAVLGCWCAPQRCHGEVIMKLWKELNR